MDIFSMNSKLLKKEKTIRVYVPVDYEVTKKRYPVLYMHDGQNVFEDKDAIRGKSLGLKRFLDEQRLDIMVVAIDTIPILEERINELCPWVNGAYTEKLLGAPSTLGGNGETYLSFIVEELKPYIDQAYRTIPDATAMAGISLGGLMSTYAACRHPHIFKRIAVFSSAFFRNQEKIEELIQETDLSSVEAFYMDCGTAESMDARTSQEFLNSNKRVHQHLRQKFTFLEFKILEGEEHDYSNFRKRVPEVIKQLLGS
ncbi:alpha/beta hydrolase [Falsibacillus albus]|uniref:Alpha/beta hydrolase n=1 Tax=Falsibacillus albus TaxID=2478915 RepID=A0A3L7JTW8_9BACI|nr:alpha/beta hydrolase-fold protein [Falsibacillus albus]RLQ94278.1 alpha/beta hydrolase [Falsibacillus albus]